MSLTCTFGSLWSNGQSGLQVCIVLAGLFAAENLYPNTASQHWQPKDAIYSTDEVIATQPGCHEIPLLVL